MTYSYVKKLIEYFLFNRYAEIGESLKTLLYETIQYVAIQCVAVPKRLMCNVRSICNIGSICDVVVPRHIQWNEKEFELHELLTKRNPHVGV